MTTETQIDQVAHAERAVIGGAMYDAVEADKAVSLLTPDDFRDRRLALIFASIYALARERKACGIMEVLASVERHGVAYEELDALAADSHYTGGKTTRNAKIVLEASQLRRIAALCAEVSDMAKQAAPIEGSVLETLDALRTGIDTINARFPGGGPISLGRAEPDLIRRLRENEPTPRGIPTGYPDIDDVLGGLRKSEMIVLAARPSVGKSLFACNIAENVAIRAEETPVLIVSLEMSASSLYRRALFGRASVHADAALDGIVSAEDKDRLIAAHGEIRRAPIDVIADGAMTPQRVHAAARRFKSRHGDCLIVIDYLQLMRGEGKGLYEQVTNISKAMKSMAVDLDIPVLVLSQLSRNAAEARDAKGNVTVRPPVLSDLRDSGAIEQDADVVIFLSRDIKQRESHPVDVGIAKNRPAKTGDTQILFDVRGPRFRTLARVHHFDGKSL